MHNINKHIIFFLVLILLSISWWAYYLFNHFPERYYGKEKEFSNSESAVIVLTGGKGRFEKGFSLLRDNVSDKLFISGVFPGVDLKKSISLENRDRDLFDCCVFSDSKAVNTVQNAKEVNKWLTEYKISKLFVVSSYYHLPRVKIIFEKEMPEKEMKLIPVDEKFLGKKNLFDYFFNIKLIITEYFKILFILIFK